MRRAFLSTTNSSVLILTDGLLGLPGDMQRLLLMRCSLLLRGGWCLLATRGPCVFVIESLSLCASLPFLGVIAFSKSLEVRSSLAPIPVSNCSLGVIMVLTRCLIILLMSGTSALSWLDLSETRSLQMSPSLSCLCDSFFETFVFVLLISCVLIFCLNSSLS